MKIKTIILISSLTTFAIPTYLSAADVNMNPGLWQWTAVMDMPGMPMQLPPASYTTCITQADFVPKNSELGQKCETIDLKTEGDRVSWNATCTQEGVTITSQGELTYYGDHAEGNVSINSQGMQMRSKTTGKRLGPCKKD